MWMRIQKASPITIIVMIVLYSFAQGISFGALFFILDLAQVAGSQYKL
jgi:hypothetical protein